LIEARPAEAVERRGDRSLRRAADRPSPSPARRLV